MDVFAIKKNIHGLKPKIHEHTGTKIIFKPNLKYTYGMKHSIGKSVE
jgi:hypothetical protein